MRIISSGNLMMLKITSGILMLLLLLTSLIMETENGYYFIPIFMLMLMVILVPVVIIALKNMKEKRLKDIEMAQRLSKQSEGNTVSDAELSSRTRSTHLHSSSLGFYSNTFRHSLIARSVHKSLSDMRDQDDDKLR